MLRRCLLIAKSQAGGAAGSANEREPEEKLAPRLTLDGFGVLSSATATAQPVEPRFAEAATRDHPPGLYGPSPRPAWRWNRPDAHLEIQRHRLWRRASCALVRGAGHRFRPVPDGPCGDPGNRRCHRDGDPWRCTCRDACFRQPDGRCSCWYCACDRAWCALALFATASSVLAQTASPELSLRSIRPRWRPVEPAPAPRLCRDRRSPRRRSEPHRACRPRADPEPAHLAPPRRTHRARSGAGMNLCSIR